MGWEMLLASASLQHQIHLFQVLIFLQKVENRDGPVTQALKSYDLHFFCLFLSPQELTSNSINMVKKTKDSWL